MKEKKKELIKNLMAAVNSMTEEEREKLVEKLGIINPAGHVLSIINQMLLYFQAGDKPLSVVAGFKQWQEADRQVNKGEHGYLIRVPANNKASSKNSDDENDTQDDTYFLWKYVFDISQTSEITKLKEGIAA